MPEKKKFLSGPWFKNPPPDKKTNNETTPPPATPYVQPMIVGQGGFVPATPIGGGTVDQDILVAVLSDLEKADLPGPDMLEFRKAYEGLMSLPLDDTAKVRAAITGLSAGAGIDQTTVLRQIVDSVPHYMNAIDESKNNFIKVLAQAKNTDIAQKEARMQSLVKTNEALQQQIQGMQSDMARNVAEMNNLSQQVADAKGKLQQKDLSLNATIEFVKNTINNYLLKIKSLGN
jgi:hypothetical protein